MDNVCFGSIVTIAILILVPVVSMITPKLNKKFVEKIFICYDRKVMVDSKKNLGE